MVSRLALSLALVLPALLRAQLTTGFVEGTLRAPDGSARVAASLLITGAAGLRASVVTDSAGAFAVTLPYGRYEFSLDDHPGVRAVVSPLEPTRLDLIVDQAGLVRVAAPPPAEAPAWPEAYGLAGLLLSRAPAAITQPLDFSGLADNRLAVASEGGVSWTATGYQLQGMDATDSYQPGSPAILPDVEAANLVLAPDATASLFLNEPRSSWHAALSTADTGSFLASDNLPAPPDRGLVQQAERFASFTRDRIEAGGPLSGWGDLYASAAGQWSSQTVPLASPGSLQHSRILYGNARSRIRATARDQFEALYSGSALRLSDWGSPAGFETLAGGRMMPQFPLPGGFQGQSESDRFDFLQAGWTHLFPRGALQFRYGYSDAHRDTAGSGAPSRIELLGGAVTGAPPLDDLALSRRHQVEGAFTLTAGRHNLAAGGGWQTSAPSNRFTTPSGIDLITAAGAPAYVVDFDTPTDSRARVRLASAWIADRIRLAPALSLDAGLLADFSSGSVPGGRPLIVWNSLSPRAGLAWSLPHARGLVLRGAFEREYEPLAGRYLDYGNPNSLGATIYQWIDRNSDGWFESGEQGPEIARFGGPDSSIDPSLRRPYSDEFSLGARIAPLPRVSAGIHLFRRDEKRRLAAIDTGVPAQAFTPVTILDPGPDGIPGTSDGQSMTVYAQSPATFGQDRFLLTNPPGLGEQYSGLVAEAAATHKQLAINLSFAAEKSYGPTNPGDAAFENDPGVVGALFADPNTAIHAAGRSFMDRAYVGKLQASYRLPAAWGGVEVAAIAQYLDGLAFARQLLVTGLPQGPIVVASTVRGSPEGGNRSQYVANCNLRVGREFPLPAGRLAAALDIVNLTNAAQRLEESDLTGPAFNLRLPVAIEPPRFVRLVLRWEF